MPKNNISFIIRRIQPIADPKEVEGIRQELRNKQSLIYIKLYGRLFDQSGNAID